MATTTKSTTTKQTTTKKKAVIPAVDAGVLDDVISTESAGVKVDLSDTTDGAVKIDDYAVINVKSNVFGKLIYIDKRTGEEITWSTCGAVQPVSFGTLRNMKMSSLAFFKNQWVIPFEFADENAEKYTPADIYKALFIAQYYKDLIEPSDYTQVCSWTPDEIRQKVSMMSKEAKGNLAVALNTYIEKGILDSLKRIKTFEEVLGCDLMMLE